jgi:hypothetical protein
VVAPNLAIRNFLNRDRARKKLSDHKSLALWVLWRRFGEALALSFIDGANLMICKRR